MKYVFLVLSLLFCFGVSAQVILQMENYGSPKTKKYYKGQELTYLLKGQEEWQQGSIEQLLIDKNIVVFDKRYTELENIEAIRTYQNKGWSTAGAVSLYTFGVAWIGYSGVSALFPPPTPGIPDPLTWGDAGVAVTSIASGFLLQRLFRHNTYRFGKKRKLRLVDMTVVPF